MDRSADNLGQTISNIQRDLEELKSNQGDGSGGGGGGGGTEYVAGNGINISDDTISVDTSVVATQSDLPTKTSDLINDGSDGNSAYVEANELADVATSGDYNDLINQPTIPNPTDYYWADVKVTSVADSTKTPSFARASFTGSNFPHLEGNGGYLTLSSGGWTANDGTIALETTNIRPANNKTTMNLGASYGKWQNLYLSGSIYKDSYALALPNKSGTVALTSEVDAKVDVQSVSLDNQTTTILAQVKALGAAKKSYGRFTCTYDGASANVSDKPTGNTNGSFVCEAYASRLYTKDDYNYQVICWVKSDPNPYRAIVTPNTTSISWQRFPSVANNGMLTVTQNGTTAGTFTANQGSNTTIALTDTTYSTMTGASASTAGTGGLVPAPSAGDQEKYLRGDGTWQPAGSSSDIPDGAVTTPKLASKAVTTAKIGDGAVTNTQIADSTIAAGKIDWSTFKYTVTGTTDGNGFLEVPPSVVNKSNGFILTARYPGAGYAFVFVFSDSSTNNNRYTIRVMNWDLSPIGNTSVTVEILYCLE